MLRTAAFLVLMLNATIAAAQTLYVNSPGDGYLNLRSGPGGNYAILGEMYHGSAATVLERSGSWLRVRHESGATGWAASRYLAGWVPSLAVYSPGDGYLNLRQGPGTGHAILRRMYNGDLVTVLGRRGSWLYIRHSSGAQGYAHSRYLVAAGP